MPQQSAELVEAINFDGMARMELEACLRRLNSAPAHERCTPFALELCKQLCASLLLRAPPTANADRAKRPGLMWWKADADFLTDDSLTSSAVANLGVMTLALRVKGTGECLPAPLVCTGKHMQAKACPIRSGEC